MAQVRAENPNDHRSFFPYPRDEDTFEELERYTRHGLHPIILGDILPKPSTCVSHPGKRPRYRIHLKIGFGAFSTVWLALDLDKGRFVAVKVGTGTADTTPSVEAQIMQHIQENKGRGQEHIVQLHDLFTIRGPNGFHECFITEVVVPITALDLDSRQKLYPTSKTLNAQIALAFDYLHSQNIAHGDPHIGNIGIAVPQIDRFNGFDLMDHIAGGLEMSPVIATSASYPMETVPAYMVGTSSVFNLLRDEGAFSVDDNHVVKILDFGRASWGDKPRPLLGACPPAFRPPEVNMYEPEASEGKVGCIWNQSADVWSVACLFFQMDTGRRLFEAGGTLIDQVFRSAKLGGPIPNEWREYSHLSSNTQVPPAELDQDENKKTWQERVPTNDSLRRLLMRMVKSKSEERPSMRDVLEDAYFSNDREVGG